MAPNFDLEHWVAQLRNAVINKFTHLSDPERVVPNYSGSTEGAVSAIIQELYAYYFFNFYVESMLVLITP